MKILYLLFIFLFLSGCASYTEFPPYDSYPDGFVRLINIDTRIIDVEKEQVNTKEELLEYFDADKDKLYSIYDADGYSFKERWITFSYYLTISITGEIDASIYEYVVYVKPLSQNKPVLNTNLYASGMPISINSQKKVLESIYGGYTIYGIASYDGYLYQSNQQVILVKGNPEYWVDSSYERNGKKFTILPVCDNSENDISELRFAYTVEKVKKN